MGSSVTAIVFTSALPITAQAGHAQLVHHGLRKFFEFQLIVETDLAIAMGSPIYIVRVMG